MSAVGITSSDFLNRSTVGRLSLDLLREPDRVPPTVVGSSPTVGSIGLPMSATTLVALPPAVGSSQTPLSEDRG